MNDKKKLSPEELNQYTTADLGKLVKQYRTNKDGFLEEIPVHNKLGKLVFLTFSKATIKPLTNEGEGSDVPETFDILDSEHYDPKDPLAEKKVRFVAALLSKKYVVEGGVYYRGKYYTHKMTKKFSLFLTREFMENYFHLEDIPLLYRYFDKAPDCLDLPYLPTHTYDGRKVIFSAYNAAVKDNLSDSIASKDYTFNVFKGDMFDLSKKEDIDKVAVIHALLNKEKTVTGFYYKGRLLPHVLSKAFKLYLEKSFVKKNFLVEQKDYLLMNITKDEKTGFPLFWPMRNHEGREIAISVLNANVSLLGFDSSLSNFDIYADKSFNFNDPVDQKKLKVIQSLYYHQGVISGALYLDGMLIPSNMKKSEVERRRMKAESATGVYLDDSEDFIRINSRFTIEDRFKLLSLTAFFDDYYPDNVTKIPSYLPTIHKTDILVRFDHVNLIEEDGGYEFKVPYSRDLKKNTSFKDMDDATFRRILLAIYSPDIKIRGAIYYKGHNVAKKKGLFFALFRKFLASYLPRDLVEKLEKNPKKHYRYQIDRHSGMLRYWPSADKNGRETLLSVVDANIVFGSGKNAVHANTNVNFDIYVGETFGLVGESGSGKTTISRAVLRINHLTSGAIYFKGKLISSKLRRAEKKSLKKNIQMIFQDPSASLNERANVDYIISEGLYNFHLFKTEEERLEKVTDMLEAVGLLPEHLSRYPHEFSGGQRQRIGIARALVIEPQLVLADEPISALDVSIRAQVLNLLKKLQKEKSLTYLFIAHDLSVIRYISDRIAVMHHGHIVELGNAEEIYAHPIHPYTKALLTAIPQPDPRSKDERKKLVYNQADIDYEKCNWLEVRPGHYILSTPKLAKEWSENHIDPKYLLDYDTYYKKHNEALEKEREK